MILWHQHVQQDVETLSEFGVEVDGDIVFEHMQYVMDCLYDVPSAPVFPKQASQPPDLSGPSNTRFSWRKIHMSAQMVDSRHPLRFLPT